MKTTKYISLIFLVVLMGCRATFNSGGKLVVSFNQPSQLAVDNVGNAGNAGNVSNIDTSSKPLISSTAINDINDINDIIAQFESIDAEGGASGNLTNKSAANCAGGVCTIY